MAALIVPSSPMLLPEYVGRQDPVGPLRERCVDALAALIDATRPARVAIVTGADREPRHHLGPLGIRVGRDLLDRAGWSGAVQQAPVPFDADSDELARAVHGIRALGGSTLLLVVADGSAKRTEKAPGHLDERAAPVDATLVAALAAGDVTALSGLNPVVCEELWLTGRAALQVLAGVVGAREVVADLLWADDPYGVQYVLARWEWDR